MGSLNSMIVAVGTIMGIVAVVISLIYIIETKRNLLIADQATYDSYSNCFFWASSIVLALSWLCIEGAGEKVVKSFVFLMLLWAGSIIGFLVISCITKNTGADDRAEIRQLIKPSLKRCILLLALAWLLNV